MKNRIILLILFVFITILAGDGQTQTKNQANDNLTPAKLKQKYGSPDAKGRYIVRPNIGLSIEYKQGQNPSEMVIKPLDSDTAKHWKELADKSKVIIVVTVEEDNRVIRPEKFKPNPDGSSPNDREIYVGRVFRVKVIKTLKGEAKIEQEGENKYANIFLFWTSGVPSIGEPKLFKGLKYVLFLEPNNEKELEGKETIEFKPNNEIVRKPFDYKSSYLIVESFLGTVQIKTDKDKLIKEIKRAL